MSIEETRTMIEEEVRAMLEKIHNDDQDKPKTRVKVFTLSAEKYNNQDISTLEDLQNAYDKSFVITMEHEHRTFKFLCERKNIFEIMPSFSQVGGDPQGQSFKDNHHESVDIILDTVIGPKGLNRETFDNLPMMFAIELANKIIREISPGLLSPDDDDDDVEEEDVDDDDEDQVEEIPEDVE